MCVCVCVCVCVYLYMSCVCCAFLFPYLYDNRSFAFVVCLYSILNVDFIYLFVVCFFAFLYSESNYSCNESIYIDRLNFYASCKKGVK